MNGSSSRDLIPTRTAGLARLAAFVPSAGRHYADKRNSDLGPDDRANVSVLSPYIRHRLLTEEETLVTVLSGQSFNSAEKFVQEVFWRTYFKGHLETRPEIWRRYQANLGLQLAAVEKGGGFAQAYRKATEGRTGIDAYDAWVAEVIETGYLHNHARMWFASIWIFTLKLPWELGADFLYRHFIDGDPASNTLSWRWVGGLHTRGKTYLARASNIHDHTGGRFHPAGLAQEATALEEPNLAAAKSIPTAPQQPPSGRTVILLTEEDLHPESWDMGQADVVAIVGATSVADRSPLEVSGQVHDFTNGAMADALARAGQHWGLVPTLLPSLDPVALEALARTAGASQSVTGYAP
ncbi:MAG: FAD-binding domain-containing protein, partial [Beijerinckiaceae bacterium]